MARRKSEEPAGPGPDRAWLRTDAARLGAARVALCAVFTGHGFIFASWAIRVPTVKQQTGASSAALGLALLGLSAGAVATMMIAGALHLRQDLGASAGLAAAGYAAFALAEATGRLSGSWMLERLDRTRVLVLGGLTACAGMLLASLAPDVWLALAGFAATGLGLANLFPAAMTRAGLLAGSGGVALASTLG
jgi:predicted MFS family arabinose efflux permease